MLAIAKQRITGASLPDSKFTVRETHRSVDVASVLDVLRGDLAAYRIRGFVPPDVCRRIVENFWASPARVPRATGYGEDGVEGWFIGASHIEKTTLEYLESARAFEDAVAGLYAGTSNPAAAFRDALVSGSGGAITMRPARFQGLVAGDSKAVYWNNNGHFLLEPHDDYAQTKDPAQQGFEIQQATRVMAINIYAEVPPGSGQLQLWNIEPDDATRAALGLTHSGFPYPADLLTEHPSVTIPVETGDLCVINGNLMHAVLRGSTAASPKKRLLLTCFTTLMNDSEILWWT
jgi:hypothetical protein